MTALDVYRQPDEGERRRYWAALEARGPLGVIAACLFLAHVASTQARGAGKGRRNVYDRKRQAVDALCAHLAGHAAGLGITWGWREDPANVHYRWVLYCDTPVGQVSFHAMWRGLGPDYESDWDNQLQTAERIFALCDQVLVPGRI